MREKIAFEDKNPLQATSILVRNRAISFRFSDLAKQLNDGAEEYEPAGEEPSQAEVWESNRRQNRIANHHQNELKRFKQLPLKNLKKLTPQQFNDLPTDIQALVNYRIISGR